MDAMMFVGFALAAVVGVVLLALMLKYLDLEEQAAAKKEGKRLPEGVRTAETIGAKMPAFFGRPHASPVPPVTQGFDDRLPRLGEIDRRHVLWVLDQAGGNHAQAARLLGTSDRTFEGLVTRYCGTSPKTGRGAEARLPKPQPWTVPLGQREALDDLLFAFIQDRIRAEQAVVSEFVHLPSVDTLYRQARPTVFMH